MKERPHLIPSIIAILMLLGSLGHWPYGYYTLLRFIVCGTSAYIAFIAYSNRSTWAVWVFAIMAVLFNPIAPFYLGREIWQVVDFISAILIIIGVIRVRKPQKG